MNIADVSEARERVMARGTFHCPWERREANYVVTQIVRDDEVIGEFVACRSCGAEYAPKVLSAAEDGEETALHAAFSLLFSAMIIADGRIKKRELSMAKRLLGQLQLDYDMDVLVGDAKRVPGDLAEVLRDASQHLSLAQRRLLLEGAMQIAVADEEFRQEERELIANAGRHMGFTRQGVNEFFDAAARRVADTD